MGIDWDKDGKAILHQNGKLYIWASLSKAISNILSINFPPTTNIIKAKLENLT